MERVQHLDQYIRLYRNIRGNEPVPDVVHVPVEGLHDLEVWSRIAFLHHVIEQFDDMESNYQVVTRLTMKQYEKVKGDIDLQYWYISSGSSICNAG